MEVRMEVLWFAQWMEKELAAHDDDRSGGWLEDELDHLFKHLEEEVNELKGELGPPGLISASEFNEAAKEQIISECADVANMAMIIADVVRGGNGHWVELFTKEDREDSDWTTDKELGEGT